MNHTAYLVLAFDISSGLPRFLSAGIYSESSASLTMLGHGVMLVDGPSFSAATYDEACALVDADVKAHPYYNWLYGPSMRAGTRPGFNRVPVTEFAARGTPAAQSALAQGARITVPLVQLAVANEWETTVADLVGKGRSKTLVRARDMSMYLCRLHLGLSFPEVTAVHGGRDPGSAMDAMVRSVKRTNGDERFTAGLERVERQLGLRE